MQRHPGRLDDQLDRAPMCRGREVGVLRLLDRTGRAVETAREAFRGRLSFLIHSRGADAALIGAEMARPLRANGGP